MRNSALLLLFRASRPRDLFAGSRLDTAHKARYIGKLRYGGKSKILLGLLLIFSCYSYALSWADLWSTKNQQAQVLMNKGQFKQAESVFQQPDWRATAAYRAGNYAQAAKEYGTLGNESGFYNQGNALAHLGHYEQAIKAYDQALVINSNNKDALYNRKLLQALLKKNKKQQGQGQQSKDQQNRSQQDQNQQGSGQQTKAQQGQQESKQQNKDQQGQSQQDKEPKQNSSGKKDSSQTGGAKNSEALEKQQAKEQWLRLIPDDPGGLLREKFLRDHLRREGEWY